MLCALIFVFAGWSVAESHSPLVFSLISCSVCHTLPVFLRSLASPAPTICSSPLVLHILLYLPNWMFEFELGQSVTEFDYWVRNVVHAFVRSIS